MRARRQELGLTLDRVAGAVGCHKSYLSQIENDRRPEGAQPSEALLARLESSLRLPEGLLVRTSRWRAMPAEVREEVRAMEIDRRAGRRLASLLKTMSLDAAHQKGELAALVAQLTVTYDTTTSAANGSDGSGAGAESVGARNGAKHSGAARSAGVGFASGARDPGAGPIPGPGARREMEIVPLPLQAPLINSVRAGYPTEFTDLGYPARVADEYVSVPDLHDPDAFAARVVGDSMAPEYREGDVVVFSPERTARSGADCFVRFERDAETTFKRVFFESRHGGTEAPRHEGAEALRHEGDAGAGLGATDAMNGAGGGAHSWAESAAGGGPDESSGEMIRLQPLNPRYPAKTLPREEVAGLYVAVWVIRAAPGATPSPAAASSRAAAWARG